MFSDLNFKKIFYFPCGFILFFLFDFECMCVPQDFSSNPLLVSLIHPLHGSCWHLFADDSGDQISWAHFPLYSVIQGKYLGIIWTPSPPSYAYLIIKYNVFCVHLTLFLVSSPRFTSIFGVEGGLEQPHQSPN